MTQGDDNTPKPLPLHQAVESGSVWEIRKLLKAGVDPNEYNEEGRMPLHMALLSGRADLYTVVEALLAHDADVNATCEPEEESPLHLVLKHAPADVAELVALRLIQHGADPEMRDRSLRNLYDYALSHSYTQLIRVMDESIHVNEAVHELLDLRVEIDARQLILAIQQGRVDDLHRCLGRGGNVNFIDPNGAGAIHYLVAVSPLNKAEVLQLLIDSHVDINLRTYEGDTALNLAIKNVKLRETKEMIPVIEMLLEHNCKTDLIDLDGKDAMTLAEERHYQDVIDLLQNIRPSQELTQTIPVDYFNYVDLEYRDYWVCRAELERLLTHSTKKEKHYLKEEFRKKIRKNDILELSKFVQYAKINLDEEDEEGQTCLHWAVLREDTEDISEIIKLLVSEGADVNARSKQGETPLHLAASRGLTLPVKTMLSLGANDVCFDHGGVTAEARATINRHYDVIKILRLHKQKRNSLAFANVKEAHETDISKTPIEEEPEVTATNTESPKKSKNKSSACVIV